MKLFTGRTTIPARGLALALSVVLGCAAFVDRSTAQPLLGSVYTTRPSVYPNLDVGLKITGHQLQAAGYSATAAPPFGSHTPTFAAPTAFGGFTSVVSTFAGATAASGAPVVANLYGTAKRLPFSTVNPWTITKKFSHRWYVPTAVFPGAVVGVNGGGGGGGIPTQTVHLTYTPPDDDDDDDDEDGNSDGRIIPGPQMVQGAGYRLDEAAQAAIAAHFGSMTFEIGMVRELGPNLPALGLGGDVFVALLAPTTLDPGQTASLAMDRMPQTAGGKLPIPSPRGDLKPTGGMLPRGSR